MLKIRRLMGLGVMVQPTERVLLRLLVLIRSFRYWSVIAYSFDMHIAGCDPTDEDLSGRYRLPLRLPSSLVQRFASLFFRYRSLSPPDECATP